MTDPLKKALDLAVTQSIYWDSFAVQVSRAEATGTKPQKAAMDDLKRWAVRNGPVVKAQFKQKGRPVSTGALESQLRTVKGMLHDRRDAFTNRARTTLALGLITLHLNELDEQHDYQRIVRDHLTANDGRPSAQRDVICDPWNKPTLRE